VPVIEIRALGSPPGDDPAAALRRICTEVAGAMDLPTRQVWATWQEIAPGSYVEGDVPAAAQPDGSHPPPVRVMARGRGTEGTARLLAAVARAVAAALQLADADNVFVVYEEMLPGRTHTGGELLR
jgi:phenylpyruvate tautomerase PptA (4-oxalocrotonate tautomerase family)